MRRARIALVLAPLVGSSIFGLGALMAFPIMLVITLAIALPLLLLLKRIERLEWWHALLAGGFCSVCYLAIGELLSSLSYSVDVDRIVDSNNVLFVGVGLITGLAFWWLGIFRNREFPFVDRRYPFGVLVVLPLAAVGIYVHRSLEPTFYEGRLITVLAPATTNPRSGQVSVRLTGGGVVQADLSNTWPTSLVGRCVHLENRWSTLRMRRIYQVDSPFGGGVDEC